MAEHKTQRNGDDVQAELMALRAEFEGSITPLQHLMARIRHHLGSPAAAILTFTGIGIWIVVNLLLARRAFDPSPFEVLNTIESSAALIATVLILAGQRRDDEASKRIAQLTLHFAAESERKSAKLIALVEALRRDSPDDPDTPDPEAERLSRPARPKALAEQLKQRPAAPKRAGETKT